MEAQPSYVGTFYDYVKEKLKQRQAGVSLASVIRTKISESWAQRWACVFDVKTPKKRQGLVEQY